MTLRGRLVRVVVAVTIVSLGGAFAAVAAAVNRSELAHLDADVRSEARSEALRVTTGARLSEGASSQQGEHALFVRLAALYDADGSVTDFSRTFVSKPPPLALVERDANRPFDVALCGDPMRAVMVPVPGRAGARLLFAIPRREVDAEAAYLRRAMIIAFAFAVAWAGFVASWVVSRLTRDNEAIAAVVRRVATGDLSARVGPRHGDPDVVRLAADVDEMVARLEVLRGTQQRFIAHAAHELRSPLTALYGELQLALRRSRDAEAYREAIREALDATKRLRGLSEDLLALARVGAEDGLDHAHLSIREVVRAVVATSRAVAEARDVAVAVDVDGESAVSTRGRRADLERMMQNLVDNAIRHSPPSRTVHVTARAERGMIEIVVADEGAGVPEEARERVFEPFFRLPRDRGTSGAGLGLPIAREIARAHGGDIRLAEGPGGARFLVRLPNGDGDAQHFLAHRE